MDKAALVAAYNFWCPQTLCVANNLTLYRMVMPIGTPFLKEKINN